MRSFEQNFIRYLNAGFPILYVDTFEDDKAKRIIHELCQQNGRGIIEWNLSEVYDYSTESPLSIPKADLATALKFLTDAGNLDNKILLAQDAHLR